MNSLFKNLVPYWRICLLVIMLATVNQVFSLLDPMIFQRILDNYILKLDQYTRREFINGVAWLMLATIGVAFVSRVAKNLQDYYLNTVIQRVGAAMYSRGVRHALSLPYRVFEDIRSGETLSVLQKMRTSVEAFLLSATNVLFVSLVAFVFVIIYAAILHWMIALMFILTVPVIGGVSFALSHRIKKIQTEINIQTRALAGSTTESLRNIELVKSLGLNEQEINRLNTNTDQILGLELQKLRTVRIMSFVQGTVVNLLRAIILIIMMYLVYERIITYGQFFTLQIYSFFVFGPLQSIGDTMTTYRDVQTALAQYEELLSEKPEIVPENAVTLDALNSISFENVSFGYNEKAGALSNISVNIRRGQTIAFVGPSGSGKTSLVKLLVGLYQPTTGSISYNGIPGSVVALSSLRNQTGFVTQETQLFAGTIRDNLRFVAPNATDSECLIALSMAACDSIMERSEKGLDTVIGEGGVKVSGGERQRLSIARALLRKPSLLICDEATSALDSITEEHITETLRTMPGASDRITVLIAHRLSTVMYADNIIVLEKGEIVEVGTHTELVAAKNLYYALWRQQVGER